MSEMKDKAKQAKQKIAAAAAAAKKISDRSAEKVGIQPKEVANGANRKVAAGAKRF